MTQNTYKAAKKLLLKYKSKADFVGEVPSGIIAKAEEALELEFTGSYLDFLQNFGAGDFNGEEIYGILDSDFENSSVPDAIWYTLQERKETNLPLNLLVIYDTGSEELFCLNFNDLDETGDPKVVSYMPGIDMGEQNFEIIAENFGDFLLELLEDSLD
ncbi:SMI1/KNR4 family protein [Planococcus sp. N064]|uniref:SMI1/KNR4 family protein n=1 Tax=Planococcus liqunii TaxID=3058394 RepID=A0ABT8MTP1_9BACL|nr:SMI1/KNR4 family protein [Planococcus sp. N064]MDN7228275.1 SMI1/KNR4 family protein [Planococcus sp. N064]